MIASPRFAMVFGLLLLFCVVSGCGGGGGSGGNPAATGSGATSGNVEVAGQLPAGRSGTLLFRNGGQDLEVPVGNGGRFSAMLAPGRYNILLKSADGKLTLIKRSLMVEDNLTITLIDVDLVPIPTVVSVSVPVVSHDSAFVEWETDLESDGRVDFGADSLYGFSTFTDTKLQRTHRIQLLGLRPSTSYHFRVVAGRHGLDEVQTYSRDFVFATDPPPDTAP